MAAGLPAGRRRSPNPGTRAPAFTAAQLSAPPTTGWLTNGGTLSNQRYSPLEPINRTNVGQLKANWRTHLLGSGAGRSTPGRASPSCTTASSTSPPAPATSSRVDRGDRHDPLALRGEARCQPACASAAAGSIAAWRWATARSSLGQLDAQLVALDQRTGKVRVVRAGRGSRSGLHHRQRPALLRRPGHHRLRRRRAGHARSRQGLRRQRPASWSGPSTPSRRPGEFGHDTWPADNEAWKYGGAPVWQTPAVDPQLGMIYFSTGNAAPGLQRLGAARATTCSRSRSWRST